MVDALVSLGEKGRLVLLVAAGGRVGLGGANGRRLEVGSLAGGDELGLGLLLARVVHDAVDDLLGGLAVDEAVGRVGDSFGVHGRHGCGCE